MDIAGLPSSIVPLDLRATPPSAPWRSTIAAIEAGDASSWTALMPSLRSLAHRIAPAFSDVVSADDVLGELALLAHERWLPEYVDRARRGEARVSVETFLRDRLRDHLRELRRRHQRRTALLAPLSEQELFVARPPRPDEVLEAAELERRAASGVTERTVLTMRAAGYDQSEIAAATKLSRPTVSRRLAAIAALIVGLGLLLLAAQWHGRPTEPIASEPREGTPRPAVGAESSDPTSDDTGPTSPTSAPNTEPNTEPSADPSAAPRTASEILDPWADQDEPPARGPTGQPPAREQGDDLINPFAPDTSESPLRIPAVFRTPRARPSSEPSSGLLDAFAGSSVRTPRDARRTSPPSPELMNPFTRERPRRTAEEAATSADESATNAPTGTLWVDAMPWALVLVDGESVGNTPVRTEVQAGSRAIELRFSNGVVRQLRVDVRAGETHRVVHDARVP